MKAAYFSSSMPVSYTQRDRGLGVLEDALGAVPAAEAGVLHAAHRRLDAAVGGRVALVDVDGAGAQPGGDLAAAPGVLRPDRGVQAVRRGVGLLDRLVLGLEAVDGDDRPEGLLGADGHGLRDTVEDGGLVEVRADVRAGDPAGDQLRAPLDGVGDMRLDRLQLPLPHQRTHVGAVGQGGTEPHRLGAGGEALQEGVGDRLVDVEPLDGDAELAGRGEAGAYGTRRGLLDVGVLQHQHGVLAAEFEGDADQAGGGALGDLAAGAGGAGEGDVVRVLDDLGSDDRALAEDDLEDLGGQAGLDEQVTGPQGGQAGLGVGLHDHRVARDEGGERVADGQLQRVVPRGDLADDAARVAQLGDLGQGRYGAGVPLGAQVGGGLAAVVPGGHRDGLDLLVGVQAGLAGLQLDEVEHLGLAFQDQVVEAEQDGGALPNRGARPDRLGGAGPVEGAGHVLGRRLGQVGQLLAGERRVVGGAAGPGHALGELGDQLGCDHVRSGAGARRAGGEGVRAGDFRGLRIRHEPQGMTPRGLCVPVGNRDSPSAHMTPVIAGNKPADQGLTWKGRT